MPNITTPEFNFASFYYPEILEALINYKRRYVPEMTDETIYEPFIQLLRAYALVGHLNNATLDQIANEAYLSTAQLVESVREHLALIDYKLLPAVPAGTEVLVELSRAVVADTLIVPANATFATNSTDESPSVSFETSESTSTARTDQLGFVFSYEAGEAQEWLDFTTEANTGGAWTPWQSAVLNDKIYFGHPNVMWNELDLDISSPSQEIDLNWEYYGNHSNKTAPSTVSQTGDRLVFEINSLVGTASVAGLQVRVTLNSTGALIDNLISYYDGANKIITPTGGGGLLGQSVVSEVASDYTISLPWEELPDIEDNTTSLLTAGVVSYTLPQTVLQNWKKIEINGEEQYWIRGRVVSIITPVSPALTRCKIDTGKQYVITDVTQGKTKTDNPLGTADGTPNQSFPFTQENFVLNSQEVTVAGEVWTEVDNFLSSESANTHYTLSLGENDRATITFGNGVAGKIPANGLAIIANYRYGADADGNVGYNTIVVDRSGLRYAASVTNPRTAGGWASAQGSTKQSLENAKIAGPAALRIKEVALNADDVATLAISYVADDGSSPFVRAKAFEGTYGPKTIELIVTLAGGGVATAEQLQGIDDYFNGDPTADPPKPKRIVANQELAVQNYSQKSIPVEATVYGNVEVLEVENALKQILQPEALEDDGITYVWDFGGEVTLSRLNHVVFSLDDSIWKVVFTGASSDVSLETRELPIYGTITITVES